MFRVLSLTLYFVFFFFFNDTATTEIYTLSLHDALPISIKFVLPGPLREPQRYFARYFLYPWWLRRDAKRAQLVHILDHTYAHMVTRVHHRPAVRSESTRLNSSH